MLTLTPCTAAGDSSADPPAPHHGSRSANTAGRQGAFGRAEGVNRHEPPMFQDLGAVVICGIGWVFLGEHWGIKKVCCEGPGGSGTMGQNLW